MLSQWAFVSKTYHASAVPGVLDAGLDAEGSLQLLLSAIARADIHPTFLAGFPIGWCNLVVDRGNTGCPQCVDVTQWTLIVTLSFGNFFLCQSLSRSKQNSQQEKQ